MRLEDETCSTQQVRAGLDWPLMRGNITREDMHLMMEFIDSPIVPRLTNGAEVMAFEEEFAQWLGSKYALMVNSGSSANLLTMAALHHRFGPGEVLVPCITWVSDIAAVLHAGMRPVFVDVDPRTLGMDWNQVYRQLNRNTRAVFPTHCLGFDAGGYDKAEYLQLDHYVEVPMIEDCCEALGAYRDGKLLGTFGLASNFSFYYAHHMTTIEGGMICTDDADFYQLLRMLRSHGLAREMTDSAKREQVAREYPDLDPQFIFTAPAWNVRPTELNAVLGRAQLKRVHEQNGHRTLHLRSFLQGLDAKRYRTDYATYGSSSYALPLVLQDADEVLMGRVLNTLIDLGVEYRRGTAGGGSQLRQPYARERWGDLYKQFPQAEHIHHYGLYVGNFPDLEPEKIEALCKALNAL